jgi:hypothetical protein
MINFFEDGLDRNPVDDCAFTPLIDVDDSDYDGEGELIGDIDYETLLGGAAAPSDDHSRT